MSDCNDIELAFIRILSVHGLVLGGPISKLDRRERIRVAIFQQALALEPFGDGQTFAQAYRTCYGVALEMRRVARDTDNLPVDVAKFDAEVDAEEEDEAPSDVEERLFRAASLTSVDQEPRPSRARNAAAVHATTRRGSTPVARPVR